MRKLLVMLAGLTLASGEGVWCVSCADDAQPGPPAATVAQAAPGKKITALGTLEPEEAVDACAQVTGRIGSIGADPRANGKSLDFGSPVEVNTVLAQIDNELYVARVEQERAGCMRAEAELEQATVNLEHAQTRWQRAQDQKKSKAISDDDFELAQFNVKVAKASVAVAEAALAQNKATLKQAEIELGYTTIKSPIKGIIIDRRINVGQMIVPNFNGSASF